MALKVGKGSVTTTQPTTTTGSDAASSGHPTLERQLDISQPS
jgi:hypothetical protein